MKTIDYLGYKITYFPEEFNLSGGKSLEHITSQIVISQDNKEKETLKFIIPMPRSFSYSLKSEEIATLAINKVKEIIRQGLENNGFKEFELVNSKFEEVIDTTE